MFSSLYQVALPSLIFFLLELVKLVNGNHKANPRIFELGFYSNNSGILVFHRVSVYWGSEYFVSETFSIVFKTCLKDLFLLFVSTHTCVFLCE